MDSDGVLVCNRDWVTKKLYTKKFQYDDATGTHPVEVSTVVRWLIYVMQYFEKMAKSYLVWNLEIFKLTTVSAKIGKSRC